MAKYIRNKTNLDFTIEGRTIEANSFWLIPSNLEQEFAQSDELIELLVDSEQCTMSSDGITDFSLSASTNIFFLQDKTNTKVKTTALVDPEDYRFRGIGTGWSDLTKGQFNNIDLMFSETEDRWITGGSILTQNSDKGDYLKFQVLNSSNVVVETFIQSWYLNPGNSIEELKLYPARIPAGYKVRASYWSNSSILEPITSVCLNYYIHRKGFGS